MKLPKKTKRHCPYCKKHTEHKVIRSKKRTPSSTHPMGLGSKKRMKKRSEARGKGNKGKFSRGAMSSWKRYGKKASKKTDLRYECQECKKMHSQRKGFRAKRLEFKT